MDKENITEKKSKKPKIVCHICKKKLKLMEQIKCECNNYFCGAHLNRHSHQCLCDVKNKKKEEIIKNNPKLSQKMVKI